MTVNCLVIGDSNVGKTSLVSYYVFNIFLDNYTPTLKPWQYKKNDLVINDTSEQLEDNDRLINTSDVVLLCYSSIDKKSFERITRKWIARIRSISLDLPIVLVSTKIDERDKEGTYCVSTTKGFEVSNNLSTGFFECSTKLAKNNEEHKMIINNIFKYCEEEGKKYKFKCIIS